MGNKGLDFKHKEVINIVDGKRLNDATELDIREWIESLNQDNIVNSYE